MQKILITILFLSTACFGCSDDDTTNLFQNVNGSWRLVERGQQPINIDQTPSIVIKNECILVNGPCNSGTGILSLSQNTIAVTELGLTEIGCELSIMELEETFVSNLSGNYIVNDGILIITSSNSHVSTFEKMETGQSVDCNR